MNKFLLAIGAIIVAGLIIAAMMFGLIPGIELDPAGSVSIPDSSCNYNERDIYGAVCAMAGKTFNYAEFQGHSDALEFKMCGVDGLQSADVKQKFETEYSSMTKRVDQVVGSSGWTGSIVIWTNLGMAYGLITGSGASVSTVYDKDTMYMTGKGTLIEWQQFLTWATT
jgi:hypothetical protein